MEEFECLVVDILVKVLMFFGNVLWFVFEYVIGDFIGLCDEVFDCFKWFMKG